MTVQLVMFSKMLKEKSVDELVETALDLGIEYRHGVIRVGLQIRRHVQESEGRLETDAFHGLRLGEQKLDGARARGLDEHHVAAVFRTKPLVRIFAIYRPQ